MKYGNDYGEYWEGIKYLIYDNVKISPNESFTIKGGSKLEIHFSYPIQNLNNFFNHDYDSSEIISIDLSHFDFSEVKYINSMFYKCSKLQVLDMSNINLKNIEEGDQSF